MTQDSARNAPEPLPSGTMVHGYRIVSKIGAGGFGVVYRAISPTGQEVAVKEYLPGALARRDGGKGVITVAPEKNALYRMGMRCFLEEGRALAQIAHPSVVNVLNFLQANDTVYLVMNYLEGATLQQFIVTAVGLNNPKVFRESTIRSLFDEVLGGLRVVHQHTMLHLDIKPANIFITEDDRAVLIDFGAARNVLHSDGKYLQPMFTPGFSGPEMRKRGSAIGPWTDIFAIGACIFSCMKGHPPPDAASPDGTNRLNQYLQELRAVYSDDLVDLVAACMSLTPNRRPHSVYALQKMLAPHEFVNDEPQVLAPPPPLSVPEPLPKAANAWSERIKALSKRLA
jgi:eukaryotic-like serine/threonine-protein kinase